MIANCTLVSIEHVDLIEKKVLDNEKIFIKEIDWETEVQIFDKNQDEERTIFMKHISMYDHYLVLNGEKHIVLHMLSKSA